MDRVIVKPVGKDKFEVYEDYCYQGICVPKGFITNGADIPRILWNIFPPNSPEYLSAVVIHDFLCANAIRFGYVIGDGVFQIVKDSSVCPDSKISYQVADKIFYEAMIEIGVSRWKAKLFYVCCSIYHRFKEIIRKDK